MLNSFQHPRKKEILKQVQNDSGKNLPVWEVKINYLKGKKDGIMKKLLVLFGLMFVIFACSNDCLNMVNECLNGNFSEKNNNENNQGNSNTEDSEKRPTTLQEVVDNANAGEEIDLSKHELTNYTATVNKKLTIKNGSLDNAKLSVKSEGVKLENLTGLSVSASSKLTITDSKLSDLLIGGSGETSRSVTSSAEGALAMVSVTNCKIENVSLDGFNSQLNITDTVTKIEDIVISTKAKIILEAGKYEGMKDPTVKDNGEIARVDMTKKTELVVLSIYSNPYKLEYNIGDKIDLTGLTVMGTYSTDVETFKSGGWKSEGEDTITKYEEYEKDYTVEYDFSTAGVSIVTIKSTKYSEITCNFHVFVKESQNAGEEKPEEKIEITDVYLEIFGTAKTTYKVGERLDLSCYQVVGKYNGFEVNLPYTSEPANGAVLETAGENIEIKFHYDGGTLTQTIKVTEPWVVTFEDGEKTLYTLKVAGGELLKLPVVDERIGYTFDGWYNGETKIEAGDEVTGNITLHAKWTTDTYTITYNLYEGENNADNPTSYNIETRTITLFSPTKTGYTFGGWYTDEAFTNAKTQIANGSTGDITLHAKWTADTYTITYNLNDGENNTNNPTSYTVETEKITLADPTRTGYTFGGWYTDSNFSTDKKVTEITKGSAGDITLYAKWTKIEEKISVELPVYTEISGLTEPRTNTDGTVIFTAPGYSNCKWYVDGDLKGQSGNEFTLNTSDMNGGIYTVMVVVTDSNGDVYSAEYRLTISK